MKATFKRIPVELLVFAASLAFLLSLEALFARDAIQGVYFQRWTSEDMMQTVSLIDLRAEPLQSLWYLHIQPPLLDALRALLAQFWPTAEPQLLLHNVDRGLYFLWAVTYAGMMALLYHWLKQLTQPVVALVTTLGFAMHPAAILYATFLENTILFSFGILWSYYELWKLSKAPQARPIWRLSLSFLLLFVTRSVYQWHSIIIYILALLLMRIPTRKILAFAALTGLVVGLYTAKQYLLFGVTFSSSLSAGNCMHGLGNFSDYAGWGVADIPISPPPAPVGVLTREFRITGSSNFNYYTHLQYHKAIFSKCFELLLTQPWQQTAYAWFGNLLIYLRPSSAFTTPHAIADRLPWRPVYNWLFSGIPLLLLICSSLAISCRAMVVAGNQTRPLLRGLGLLLPALMIFLMTVIFERGENMRYKFFLEPVFYTFVVAQIYSAIASGRKPPLIEETPCPAPGFNAISRLGRYTNWRRKSMFRLAAVPASGRGMNSPDT
ncbi:MAG: hypothetical protein AB1894_19870 [Chloroflexota bacterium]